MTAIDTRGRHASVASVVRHLEPNPNLPAHLYEIADKVADLTAEVLGDVQQDSPELAAGLRKLLEAKDCFVRARLDQDRDA